MSEPSFTIGIEEEYLLVDKQEPQSDRRQAPDSLMTECERRLEGRVSPEFLQSQIEVGTSKCATLKDAAAEIRAAAPLTVAEVAGEHGLAPIAASTHPFAAVGRAEAHRQGALQHPGPRHASGGAPAPDLRHARPRRAWTTTSLGST